MSSTSQKEIDEKTALDTNSTTIRESEKEKGNGVAGASSVNRSSRQHEDSLGGHEWEIVSKEEGEPDLIPGNTRSNTRSAHYELNIGWGRWKHQLATVDWSYTRRCACGSIHADDEGSQEEGQQRTVEDNDGNEKRDA